MGRRSKRAHPNSWKEPGTDLEFDDNSATFFQDQGKKHFAFDVFVGATIE